MTLLSVRGLETTFFTREGEVRAVDGVSFDIERGQVLCLVGESGSGKSVAALSILGLVPNPPGRITKGAVYFAGAEDLVLASEKRLREVRGNRIAMVFQDPMTSLNPYLTVGTQLVEVLELHRRMPRREAETHAVRALGEVGISAPESRLRQHPHELSGGMRQRVMIAMALACEPDLLIADEPTTALDVTVQAQILDLIDDLRRERGLGVLFITHDLGVVTRMADRVAVMYAGRIVEEGYVDEVFARPRHPYTEALRHSTLRIDTERVDRLPELEGLPPSPGARPPGCAFEPRCRLAVDACRLTAPEERFLTLEHRVRCHVATDGEEGT